MLKRKGIMRQTPLESKIESLITPVIENQGLRLVQLRLIGEGGSRNLQILAEDPATRNLGVDQCADISRAVSALLDVEDPIQGSYRLEVSSPGIDRPLVRIEDYETFKGLEAKIETSVPDANGQKKYRGMLEGQTDGVIRIVTDQGPAEIDFNAIVKAKLVLNDALIKATAQDKQNKQNTEV